MKVKIIDNSGAHVEIDARSLEIDGKTISTILGEFRRETEAFKAFKASFEKQQEELKAAWKKIR